MCIRDRSNCGSLPEVVGAAGLLLDPDDDAAWAAALERVLTDSALSADLVARGRVQAQKFSWRETAVKTLALYRGQTA